MRPALPRLRSARSAALLALALTAAGAGAVAAPRSAHASVTRIRLGSSSDVSRTSWNGPAFTFNGDGAVVPATAGKAIAAITGGSGSIDVTVLADSAATGSSQTPECDVFMGLSGVNSCTTDVVTSAADGNSSQVNTDVRNAEFVYFAGGNQCVYASWKGTSLQASVQSVVAKGGGSGGGSAGHHINSAVVYDACTASTDSPTALANPYDRSVTFTTGMFAWPNYADTVNDSHFVTRDRMGRTMAFVARAVKDGLTTSGKAWGVGVEQGGGSLFLDKNGLATLSGSDAYVVLGDHQPEQAVSGKPLTYSNFKIWHLTAGQTFDFKNRPTCGYYTRSVTNGTPDANLYSGTPTTDCGGGTGTGTGTGSSLTETEPNDSTGAANDITGLGYPATVTGSMKSGSDRDYYKLSLTSGQTATVTCTVPSAYDADLYFMNANGSTLTRSVNNGKGAGESLSWTATSSGTYYADLEAYSGSGSATYSCKVTKG
ncbi:pre-peptidase C-terminal domain-containing protein [Kitasatospora sp. NA04385]|uniref:pre-peptidase C-terminal domain-containing protein n=1 Tax=Kitasatospora sp. NA04385 TaxID=2742135 RepID=UPI00158FB319|nr:pre-peptidase C-terminal domain-containing protein [Kitasatospora sp. NA04385]QKW23123.1 pre-peptidase C-terminal domain-containing protein [Kitasatospora sp. NA04385]